MIVTDELSAYPSAMTSVGIHGSKHETIKHKERLYARGNVHTNTIESAFSLLKCGLVGSFHQFSIKREQTVRRMSAVKAMPYRKLVERKAFTPFVRK